VRITWHRDVFVLPILQRRSNEYYTTWVCICSLGYPACNAHAPYCHVWHAPLYNIFPHFLINGTNFERKKKLLNTKMCVFWFSLQILSETFLIPKRNERGMVNTYIGLHVRYILFLTDFDETSKFWYFRKILKYQISRKFVHS